MHRLLAALAGVALVVSLSGPAWAHGVQSRHHRFSGRSASDSPGEGRSHYDKVQHDDPTLF